MKEDLIRSAKIVLEFIAVALMILLTIGFFNTPFEGKHAQKVDGELLAEREYVEKMTPAIEKFTEQTLDIQETSEKYGEGKIVTLKVSQVYSETFDAINKTYNELSSMEVPDRFKQFHVSYLKSMEYQGASINEVLVYLQDKDPNRIANIDKYNDQFIKQYNDAIALYNRLLDERKVK